MNSFLDEKQLLSLLKKGDEKAFGVVFENYAPDLYYFSLGYLKNETDAQEIVQETFLKILETHQAIDPSLNFKGYLTSIAKNKIYSLVRKRVVERKYEFFITEMNDSASIDNRVEHRDLEEYLLSGLEKLPLQQREVMYLKSKGLSNDKIAQILNLSRRTVEGHINKAYKELRSDLHQYKDFLTIFLCG